MMFRGGMLLASALAAVVLVAVLMGLYLIGSPAEARLRRFDERRVDDLRTAHIAIQGYWTARGGLPPDLDSVRLAFANGREFKDPSTGAPYVYQPTGDGTYRLCADFAQASPPDSPAYETAWLHPAGHYCFPLVGPPKPPTSAPPD
jgi:hypothetical protein